MSNRFANVLAFLIATAGMAVAAHGLLGADPTATAHHNHTESTRSEHKQ
jgi:hypothetical protein